MSRGAVFAAVLAALAPAVAGAACPPAVGWSVRWGAKAGDYDEATSVAVNAAGEVFVVGWQITTAIPLNKDWMIRKYDDSGALQNAVTYDGAAAGIDIPNFVAVASDGDVVVAGYETVGGQEDWMIRKYTPDLGTVSWSRSYQSIGGYSEEATGVATGTNAIYVVGYTATDSGSTDTDWLIQAYDNAGNLQWSRTYDGPSHSSDIAESCAVDAGGNLVVVGYETAPGQDTNWLVRKYDSTGELLWSRSYNSPANTEDMALAVAIDKSVAGDGDIVAVGYETRTDTYSGKNWLIHRYSSTGLWKRWRNYSEGSTDKATCVAVDSAGNSYVGGVIGRSWLGSSNDWMVQKCGPDLDPIWVSSYTSPGAWTDELFGLALAPSGNVILAGYEYRDTANKYEDWLIYSLTQPATCSGQPVMETLVDHTPVVQDETMTLTLRVTNPSGAAITGLVPQRTYSISSGSLGLTTVDSPSVLASLAAGASADFDWTLKFTGNAKLSYITWAEYDIETGLKVCGTFPETPFQITTLANAAKYTDYHTGIDIRNNVIRIRKGTIAYIFVRGADKNSTVDLAVYGASGTAIGKLPPVTTDSTGKGTASFDGRVEGRTLRTGVYQVTATGGVRDRKPVMVINE